MTDNLHVKLSNHRTTFHILSTTFTALLHNNALTFALLSLLILSFRTVVENGSHHLTSFIDNDPALKSLLSRIDLSATGPHLHHQNHQRQINRRRPFLHLTRVGTLDDDFFSGDETDSDRTLFNGSHKKIVNGSYLIYSPKIGFSGRVVDNGIRLSEVVKPGFGFKIDHLFVEEEGSNNKEENEGLEKVVDLEFFMKGFEMGKRDAAALFFLVTFLSAVYGWVVIGFLVTYSSVLGVVFVTVVNDLLGRFSSFFGVVWDGSKLGFKRLSGFILMRWAVRDALTQLLGLWYFGEIEDQFSFFKLFVRLKLMPFSIMSPWIRGFEKEISGFLFTWFMVDTFVGFIFTVDAWVAIVDTRRTGREIVKEGFYLLLTMFHQAVQIRCLEAICCGSFVRWALARVCGKSFAAIFQSAAEVYFMAAWLVFYLAARCKDANLQGQRFGRREVEGFIEGLR